MAELTDDQKAEIVAMLACFREPAQVIDHFRVEHGLELAARQVGAYDPTRSYFEAGDKWREIFAAKRKAYLEEVSSVPIANQGFRLNVLHEQLKKALASEEPKPGTVMALLEQAAKETGGLLTNDRNLRIDDNRDRRPSELTPEERTESLTELIRVALKRLDPPGTSEGSQATQ